MDVKATLDPLRTGLHNAILDVIENRDGKMSWQDFKARSKIPWDRHKQWKFKEWDVQWSTDKYVTVAIRVGVPTSTVLRLMSEALAAKGFPTSFPSRTAGTVSLAEDAITL